MMRLLPAAFVMLLADPALAQDDEDKGFLGLHEADLRVKIDKFDMLISGIVDLEYYQVDQQAPGLIFADYPYLNRRATLFIDAAVGDHLFFFVQGRVDEGFDPHYMGFAQGRFDEYFGRYTISDEGWSASLQIGKFATPLGNWVPRHDTIHNALVRSPIVYDYLTTVSDQTIPAKNQALINRRDHPENRHKWQPIIWGPDYATGAMIFGKAGNFEARFAVTNGAPSERPSEWDWQSDDLQSLNFSGRIGWQPFLGFKIGLNASYGPYLNDSVLPSLPSGSHLGDFAQKLFGVDLEYAIGHLEAWAEVYATEWEAPNIDGHLRAFGYYIEGKYTLFPRFYVAARWGQIIFNNITNAAGNDETWDRNTWRLEFGVGYRIYENLLAKAQYEVNFTSGPSDPHDNMASFSLSLSF